MFGAQDASLPKNLMRLQKSSDHKMTINALENSLQMDVFEILTSRTSRDITSGQIKPSRGALIGPTWSGLILKKKKDNHVVIMCEGLVTFFSSIMASPEPFFSLKL